MLSPTQRKVAKQYKKKFWKSIDKDYYLQEARSKGYTDIELFLMANPKRLAEYEYFNSQLITNYPPKTDKEEEDIPF